MYKQHWALNNIQELIFIKPNQPTIAEINYRKPNILNIISDSE